MNVLKSKININGTKVSIVDAGEGKKEFYALGKRYWISYGENPSSFRCVNCSNSLKYIEKKFSEIK